MRVRNRLLQKGIRKGPSLKIAVKLPGALSLADLDRNGKYGVPLMKRKIVTGPFRKGPTETGVHVGTGKSKASNTSEGSRSVICTEPRSPGGDFSRRTPSRSESCRARLSREGGGHSSTRISPSNQTKLVLPHESAL